jgi:L-malate glycosyltransferase
MAGRDDKKIKRQKDREQRRAKTRNCGDMNSTGINICFIGSMLGNNSGYVTTQGQILAELFAAEDGYRITCVSSRINRATRLLEIIAALIFKGRKFDVAILEVYSGLSFFIAETVAALCRIINIPLIMVLHGGNLPEFIAKNTRRVKFTLNKAQALVAPSGFLAEKLAGFGFQVRVIPNVLDLNRYAYRKREIIRPQLFWMRSFHEIYNPQMAVDVLLELKKSYPEARLVMAGVDKGLQSQIREKVELSGLSKAVRFAGFLDEEKKRAEFSLADVYLNTNRIDNMPVSVVEACASGLPVVATRVGGLSWLLKNGENGLLVESENTVEMVRAVKKLLAEPNLTERISRNARRLAERSDWSKVKSDWENLLSEILISAKSRREKSSEIKQLPAR